MAQSVARGIIEAANVRLKNLDLSENNEIFVDDNVPATTRDKSFSIKWLAGALDVDSPGVNRKVTIERELEIKIFYKAFKLTSGERQKAVLLEAYDIEQTVFANMMISRLTTSVRHEQLTSTNIDIADVGGDEWLVNTMLFTFRYEVNV